MCSSPEEAEEAPKQSLSSAKHDGWLLNLQWRGNQPGTSSIGRGVVPLISHSNLCVVILICGNAVLSVVLWSLFVLLGLFCGDFVIDSHWFALVQMMGPMM